MGDISYQFRSLSIVVFSFVGLAFIGFSLGFMFWLDFRKRFINGGRLAALIVLIAG